MTRLEANRKILEKLSQLVEKYPDWRFGQLMRNAGVVFEDYGERDPFGWQPIIWVDEFSRESDSHLERIETVCATHKLL